MTGTPTRAGAAIPKVERPASSGGAHMRWHHRVPHAQCPAPQTAGMG